MNITCTEKVGHVLSMDKTNDLIKNSPAVKKVCGHCEKRCEIQGSGQEMAVMVG